MTDQGNKATPKRTLTVKNFSVIKGATLTFGKITVLIGPEASGKSLLCKLAYFLGREVFFIAEGRIKAGLGFANFNDAVTRDFERWFPKEGWGSQSWSVSFTSDRYEVELLGNDSATALPHIGFSKAFQEAYESSLSYEYPDSEFWPAYNLRGLAGVGVWDRATYIPSERTYFVDTNKEYRALVTDGEPVVKSFSLLYSSARDPEIPKPRLQNYLKGNLIRGEDAWNFAFDDGRVLPLNHLSSGAKELLPLLCVLEMYEYQRPSARVEQPRRTAGTESWYRFDDFFVEEPEGHVFPQTQQQLIRYFSEIANSEKLRARFVITTHSPYILSSFNNLIEASQAARNNPQLHGEIAKIVPEQYWIKEGDFAAYAIEDGELASILNESGFIDANYLDQVSEVIGNEFDQLLRLEYEHTKAS